MSDLVLDIRLQRDDFELDVAFQAERGETIAIVGPNGAGKSTCVRALTGLEPIDDGRIELAGRVLDSPDGGVFVAPHERHIGTAFQDALLFPHLSAADNVAFGLDGDRPARRASAATWLERVGLAGFDRRKATDLSGGEARRVAIARALAIDPDLVILDEPFAGLDVGARATMRRVVHEHVLTHRSVRLLITHDPADTHTFADRVIVIERGAVAQIGTPSEIQQRPATPWVADLVGVNLLRGVARSGVVRVNDRLELRTVDADLDGDVVLTVAPHAVALHGNAPSGSPRNTWQAIVGDVHRYGDVMRVRLDDPVPLVVDVTPSAVDDLAIAPGRALWVAVKATSLDARTA